MWVRDGKVWTEAMMDMFQRSKQEGAESGTKLESLDESA